jgi:hypothetical protein
VDLIHKSITSYLVDKLSLKPQDITLKNIRKILDNFTWVNTDIKESLITVFEEVMRIKFATPQLKEQLKEEKLVNDLKSKTSMIIEKIETSEARNNHRPG